MAIKDKDGQTVGYKRKYDELETIIEPNNPIQATIEMVLKRRGRPANYPCTPAGYEQFVENTFEYLNYVRQKNESMEKALVLDIESWAVYLGVTRVTLWTYEKRGGEWTQFIGWFKELILSIKKQAMFNYAIPPVVGIFDLKNNHGYTDRTEIVMDSEQLQEQAAVERQLEDNGLVWNEATQSFEVIGE